MTYKPVYPRLTPLTFRGVNQPREFKRPDGVPYPDDRTYRYMVGRVDTFPTAYQTDSEIQKRRVRRRRWLESVTMDEDGCWLWLGPVNKALAGAPVFRGGAAGNPVVRANWFMIREWFPELLNRDKNQRQPHTATRCGKRLCVRPQCRYRTGGPGTDRGKLRSLTPDQVREARRLSAADWSPGAVAEKLGVRVQVIKDLKRGKSYRWVSSEIDSEASEVCRPSPGSQKPRSGALRGAQAVQTHDPVGIGSTE